MTASQRAIPVQAVWRATPRSGHGDHQPEHRRGPFARRVALVTGATHGIGTATARLLASLGAAVRVNYHHDGAAAAAVAGDIRSAGGRAAAIQAYVTDADEEGDQRCASR